MKYLVDLDDVLQALVDCESVKGYAYVSLENMIKDLPVRAVIYDCECGKCKDKSIKGE